MPSKLSNTSKNKLYDEDADYDYDYQEADFEDDT